jgi:hypothetical protein
MRPDRTGTQHCVGMHSLTDARGGLQRAARSIREQIVMAVWAVTWAEGHAKVRRTITR